MREDELEKYLKRSTWQNLSYERERRNWEWLDSSLGDKPAAIIVQESENPFQMGLKRMRLIWN